LTENTCKRELLIEVPVDVVREATDKVAKDILKKARIPGFRPGKAPMSFVKQQFGAHIRDEVLQDLIPKHFRAKAEEEKVLPVAMPDWQDVVFEDDKPLTFKAVFEVLPEFELGEYKGLEVEYADPEAKDSEVELYLERMRQRDATFEPIEGRPLADGDFAEVSFEGTPISDKGAPIKVDDVLVEVGGKDTVPEFNTNLLGKAPGDETQFEIEYPADYHDKRLAGRKISYQVKVHASKKRVLAELDDDFAKATGEFDTLDEMREDIKARLLDQKKNRRQNEAKNKLIEKLADLHTFDVPDAMVERQLEIRAERLASQLRQQNIDPAKSIDWAKWRESSLDAARKEVRAELLLDKIADRENIQATDEEYNEEISYMARAMRQSEDQLRNRIKREGTEGRVRYRIRNAKATELLFKSAKYVEPAPAAPGTEDAETEDAEDAVEADSVAMNENGEVAENEL
jgi:trigger factor